MTREIPLNLLCIEDTVFLQTEGLSAVMHQSKSVGTAFQHLSLHVFVSHFSNFNSSNFFIINIFIIVICDQ